jgi:hypothetical protein
VQARIGSVVIGIFYERPDGSIVKTYGWDGTDKIVSYYDEVKYGYAHTEEFETWKPRQDLNDFPNAKDPILPYEFDLCWDIKHTSQLRKTLENDHPDKNEILEMMESYGITI